MAMNRAQVTTFVELIGGALVTIGACLLSIPFGLIVAGVCLIAIGWANS